MKLKSYILNGQASDTAPRNATQTRVVVLETCRGAFRGARKFDDVRRRRLAALACFVLLFCGATAYTVAFAQDVAFPVGSGVINVKNPIGSQPGATGDGITDDTAAIQRALNSARTNLGGRTVYFPNGIYKVSDTLVMTDYDAANTSCSHRSITVQGQSREGVIIRLADAATSFGASARKPVLTTFRPTTIAPPCTPTAPAPQTFTNSAFSTNIQNLTVDIGSGNAGATGINYIANNQGSLRDVLIRTSDAARAGFSGLDLALSRIAGPALIKNLTVEGFDYGIRTLEAQYSTVYENITLRNQNRSGIHNQAHVLSIRRLISQNSVPAVRQVAADSTEPGGGGNSTIGFSKGVIVLLDSTLTGGASGAAALDIQDGYLFARNITTAGYDSAINDQGTVVTGSNVSEYRTGGTTYKLFPDSPDTSLNLEIRDTPEVPADDLANESLRCRPSDAPCANGRWASVSDFGATQNDRVDDDTDEIQAALDSGASTIFFPNSATNEGNSRYNLTRTLTVSGSVRRIIGNSCSLTVSSPLTNGGAVFKFVDGNQSVRLIEGFRLHVSQGTFHFIEQASSQTLVLRNLLIRRGYAYRNTGFGDVFIEDFHNLLNGTEALGASFIFRNQRVWARQINPEVGTPEIINDGATLWILGIKTEQQYTLIETRNGGRTEVLGGLSLISRAATSTTTPPAFPVPPVVPAFLNDNSFMSIVHTEFRQNPTRGFFPNVVREVRGSESRTLLNTDLPSRPAAFPSPTPSPTPSPYSTTAYVIPLYTGYQALNSTLVSGQTTPVSSGLGYNRFTRIYGGTITVTNTGSEIITGPLQVVLLGLPADVTLVNAAGTYGGNNPYVTASITTLAPGQSVSVPVQFMKPDGVGINYIAQIYSGTFQQPSVVKRQPIRRSN